MITFISKLYVKTKFLENFLRLLYSTINQCSSDNKLSAIEREIVYWFEINKEWEKLCNNDNIFQIRLCKSLAGKHLNTIDEIKKFNSNLKDKVDGIKDYTFSLNSILRKELSRLLNLEPKMPVVFLFIAPNGLQYSEEGDDSHCIVVICEKNEKYSTNS